MGGFVKLYARKKEQEMDMDTYSLQPETAGDKPRFAIREHGISMVTNDGGRGCVIHAAFGKKNFEFHIPEYAVDEVIKAVTNWRSVTQGYAEPPKPLTKEEIEASNFPASP